MPLTADPATCSQAIEFGRRIVWAATSDEHMAKGTPLLPADRRPRETVAFPDTEEGMPTEVVCEPATQTLSVGQEHTAPVPPEVWSYEVSTHKVIQRWLNRRLREPKGPRSSLLDGIVTTTWTPAMTTELLEPLNVMGLLVDLEGDQAALLEQVQDEKIITVEGLPQAGVLPPSARNATGTDDRTCFGTD